MSTYETRLALQVKRLVPKSHGNLYAPVYPGDVGYDIAIAQDFIVPPNEVRDCPTDIAIALPEQTWGLVVGRSSSERKLGVRVTLGVIDWGYTGPLFVSMQSLDKHYVSLQAGTRVAQLIVVPAVVPALALVEELPTRERGANGFGSTGHR